MLAEKVSLNYVGAQVLTLQCKSGPQLRGGLDTNHRRRPTSNRNAAIALLSRSKDVVNAVRDTDTSGTDVNTHAFCLRGGVRVMYMQPCVCVCKAPQQVEPAAESQVSG